MRWHFMTSPPDDGVTNMALDEALMRRAARTSEAVFRVYGWSEPTLSLGRNQRARDCYDLSAARTMGVGFVRRPTGGRALLHHREITYSVTLPADHSTQAGPAYAFINDVLLLALGRLGVSARLASEGRAVPPGLRPCFDVPSPHEIVLGERKLIGSAQWRRAGALLQHGSILIQDDQGKIGELLTRATIGATSVAATLFGVMGREPSIDEMALAIREALREKTGSPVPDLASDHRLTADTEALRRVYADEGWTWRR